MPELPEVETVCRGIARAVLDLPIVSVIVNNPHLRLRYPFPVGLHEIFCGDHFHQIVRRGKYLLFYPRAAQGALIVHLGMSGKLFVMPQNVPMLKHEHLTITFQNGLTLRFIDPRRFGAIVWAGSNDGGGVATVAATGKATKGKATKKKIITDVSSAPLDHPMLKELGVEPLTTDFNAGYLHAICRKRHATTVKQLIMDNKVVVGVGNIYAAEALFASGIKPSRRAGSLGIKECARLVRVIKHILQLAIKCGGTTIRDFAASDGGTGYFVHQLQVYGRGKQPCRKCGTLLRTMRLGQRSTVYCAHCQR
jgi:formamidopyrimidine-DNA glycosylase